MNIEASMIRPNGEVDSISLPEDEVARLRQLQEIVGGYIEVVALCPASATWSSMKTARMACT